MFHADSLDNFRRLTASNQHGFFHLSAAAERKKKRIAREDARAQSLVRSISDRTYFFAYLCPASRRKASRDKNISRRFLG
jgi:hypothetical protein